MMTASSRRALAVLAFALAVLEQQSTAQSQDVVLIPTSDDGYYIDQKDEPGQNAPSGFVGRTDGSTLTAVGSTDATRGRNVVAHFKISNKIWKCPDRDGVVEGEGEFSVIVDSTDEKANSTQHFVMQAKAKYKGEVNDEAWLKDAVKAEIDYTKTLSSSIRGANGALVTPAGTNSTQHVSVPVLVGPGMSSPQFGPFSGGDPSHGRVSEAYDASMGLAYWAGIYYSEAQHKWRDGLCAELSFDPPSRTLQPPPRTEVKVKAQVKSKRGGVVKAHFQEVETRGGSSVSPSSGWSSDTVPLTFTYTAPNQRTPNATPGFEVLATSRAGIAKIPAWYAALGTDWSGQIECSYRAEESGRSEQQTWSYSATRYYAVDVNNGSGEARGSSDQQSSSRTLRPVARVGYVYDRSDSHSGSAQGERTAKVTVELNTVKGTYQIKIEHRPFDVSKMEWENCDHTRGCEQRTTDYGVEPCPPGPFGLFGEFTNPNEVSGSTDETKTGTGRSGKGTVTWTFTWHLSRQGSTR